MAAASIVIDLLMRTGSFETDTGRAERSLKKLQGTASSVGVAVGAALATGTAAITALVKSSINAADELSKASQKIGVSVEALSGLKYAADLADVSFEGLTNGLKKLSTSMFDADKGSKEQANAFKMLGINVNDASGNLKQADVVLSEIATRFANMKDGTEKTALAVKLFGRAGADLIPLLNQGAAGIANATEEARKFGLIVDTESAKAAEQFNDDLNRLSKTAKGLGFSIAKEVLPAMTDISKAMAEAAKEAGLLTALWVGMGGLAAHALGLDDASKARDKVKELSVEISRLQKQLGSGSLNPEGASDKFFNFLVPDVRLNEKAKATLKTRLDALVKERDAILKGLEAPKVATPNFEPPIDLPEEDKKDKKTAAERFAEQIADLKQVNELLRQGVDLEEAGFIVSQRRAGATDEQVVALLNLGNAQKDITDKLKLAKENEEELYEERRKNIEAIAVAQKDEIVRLNELGKAIKDQVDPGRELNKQLEDLNKLVDTGRITFGEYGKAVSDALDKAFGGAANKAKETTDEITEFWKEAARNMQDAMGDFFFDIMQGELSDLGDSFKKTIDRMVANVLAAKAATALFGDMGSSGGGELGGFVGTAVEWFKGLSSFAVGTDYVPHDMVAKIHKGERIVPASQNNSNWGGGMSIVQNFSVSGNPDRRTQQQLATAAMLGVQRGQRNA